MRFALLLFILMPILEMWLLITIGSYIGALSTILLVMLTALIGIGLLREQGVSTLWRGREKLHQGKVPAQEIMEGIVLAVSGALLLTPGFVTDAIGLMGLLPFSRIYLVKGILQKVTFFNASAQPFSHQPFGFDTENNGNTIDGEAWDSEESLKKPK
ncbi:MAG: FxsA family protein [Porticoccaceae bacterium]